MHSQATVCERGSSNVGPRPITKNELLLNDNVSRHNIQGVVARQSIRDEDCMPRHMWLENIKHWIRPRLNSEQDPTTTILVKGLMLMMMNNTALNDQQGNSILDGRSL